MKRLTLLSLAACLLAATTTKAQVDPHFSQYYADPLWLNPALTGAIDGDYRLSANYRNQWANISNPFTTIGVSGDFVTSKKLNFGANILNQSAGNGGYNNLNASISVAFTGIRFGRDGYQKLILALQGGILNRRFDPSKFQYGDQWNPVTGYDPMTSSSDHLTRNSSSVFDAGAGLLYFDGNPNRTANVFAGFAANHLTRPEDPFISGATTMKLPYRFTAHAGVRIAVSEAVRITPNALYMKQGTATEKMVGAYAQIVANNFTDLLVGGYYRFNDAAVPFVGIRYQNLQFGFSYDANASKLGSLAKDSNSFEFSVSFLGKKAKVLPDEYFFCPRL